MNRYTKMRDRTDDELKLTIETAITACSGLSPDLSGTDTFWRICSGVDAYFEQRRRKEKVAAYGMVIEQPVDPSSPAWNDGEPAA